MHVSSNPVQRLAWSDHPLLARSAASHAIWGTRGWQVAAQRSEQRMQGLIGAWSSHGQVKTYEHHGIKPVESKCAALPAFSRPANHCLQVLHQGLYPVHVVISASGQGGRGRRLLGICALSQLAQLRWDLARAAKLQDGCPAGSSSQADAVLQAAGRLGNVGSRCVWWGHSDAQRGDQSLCGACMPPAFIRCCRPALMQVQCAGWQ